MEHDKFYHLVYSDYCLHPYFYICKVLANVSFGLLQVFHVKLRSLQTPQMKKDWSLNHHRVMTILPEKSNATVVMDKEEHGQQIGRLDW